MRLNFGGYRWIKQDGYGRFCLNMAKALIQAGHDMHPFEMDDLDKPAWYQRATGLDFSRATVMLCPPHMMHSIPGRNFSWTMHETETLPDGWADHINNKSQWLFTPTPSLIPVFEDAGVKIPIEVVPGGISPEECPILRPVQDRPFTFGCLADRGGRKGHQSVWTAFYKAFDFNNKNVRLLVKCRPGSLPHLDFSYSADSRLTVWKADVDDIADIYQQMDAFMFPTKFEGYGMPCREAAACGVPTVVTRYSGTADDCDEWAFPLEKFTKVESKMIGCGGLWAEPDVDELVWRMRDIYQHQDEYREKALVKAQWLRNNNTYAHAANKLVNAMAKYLGGKPSPEPEPSFVQNLTAPVLPDGHVKEMAQ